MQNLWTQYQGNSLYQWRCGRYNRWSSDSASRKCFCIFSIRYSKYGIGYGATSGNHSMTFFWALRKNLCKFNNSDKKRDCERLEKQPLNFLQYTINTVICQVSPTVSLSVYMISSSPRTLSQFLSGIVHFFVISWVARYKAFKRAVSLGNTLLCLFRRR